MDDSSDVVVVGGGLAGLTAAALLARAGRRVTLLEKAAALGGRAATHQRDGFCFNLGPHALLRGGVAMAVLRGLGIEPRGRVPASSGHAVVGSTLHALPVGFLSLASTGLFPLAAKLETGRLLSRLPGLDTRALAGVTVTDWLAAEASRPDVRALILALVRLTSFSHDPDRRSAGAAIEQLQLASREGVLYVDGGWGSLVAALRALAVAAGARVCTGVRVVGVVHDEAVRGVRLADGSVMAAGQVILAGSATTAAALVPGSATLAGARAAAEPVRAACLDLGLDGLPRPRSLFALGIDAPTYLSVHSATAVLAPPGGALIHVAKVLAPGEDGAAALGELETLCDRVQAGWRERVVARRWLPELVVASDAPLAGRGGLPGRPGVVVPGIAGLLVAGDWVGGTGQLADASLASARAAALAALAAPSLRAAA